MKPPGIIQLRPDRVARVCSWCEAEQEKRTGITKPVTLWCENCGYEVTHGICDKHAAELKAGLPRGGTAQPMKPACVPSKPKQREEHSNGEDVSDDAENRAKFIHGIDAWLARNRAEGKRQV